MIDGPVTLPPVAWAEILAAYSTPLRHYHTFGHVREVVRTFETVPTWTVPNDVFVAVLYHDAIYEAGRADNEVRSATMAMSAIARFGLDADAARVGVLIALTARHGQIAPDDVDADAAMFLDCDMAILAAAPPTFQAYEAAIAAEYEPIYGDRYVEGRRAFLKRLLDGNIFLSPLFRDRHEETAKANIRESLSLLPPA